MANRGASVQVAGTGSEVGAVSSLTRIMMQLELGPTSHKKAMTILLAAALLTGAP